VKKLALNKLSDLTAGVMTRSGLADTGLRIGRFLQLLGYRFVQDGGLHHTASLTYTTLLSLVPLMTVSLAIFSAFPVSDQVATEVQDFMFKNLVPTSGEVIREHLQDFSTKASRLTGAGTVFLIIVAIMMMGTIDRAFNTIWQVRRKRSALSIFVVYWAILSLGPIFMGLSVVLTSYLVSMPILTDAAETIGIGRAGLLALMPVLASSVAFTLLYLVVPNRSVPLRHAVAGGMLAAVLFELAKRGFALFRILLQQGLRFLIQCCHFRIVLDQFRLCLLLFGLEVFQRAGIDRGKTADDPGATAGNHHGRPRLQEHGCLEHGHPQTLEAVDHYPGFLMLLVPNPVSVGHGWKRGQVLRVIHHPLSVQVPSNRGPRRVYSGR